MTTADHRTQGAQIPASDAWPLFLAGKIRIEGDFAKTMLLGMTLAQLG